MLKTPLSNCLNLFKETLNGLLDPGIELRARCVKIAVEYL